MLQTTVRQRLSRHYFVGFVLSSMICFGCSSGEDKRPTAPVSGKMSFQGNPVTGGSLTFSPIMMTGNKETPGSAAFGNIEPDGSFTLTTYKKGDGAIVGKHRVTFGPPGAPPIDEKEHSENSKPVISPYYGLMPKVAEVEVKSGDNKIDIELIPDPKVAPPGQ